MSSPLTQRNPSTLRYPKLLMALCCLFLSGCSVAEATSGTTQGAVTGFGGMLKIMAGTEPRKESVTRAKEEPISDEQLARSKRLRGYNAK